ncbi:DUF1643 domain-containing protein [Robiginitalea sp. IMCC43444]|uniref:DUF1643 domain-containing protein n=1 Tax=Robiginitalea sp. IMCC43444 TaxID=3459121 RepID=UPI0040411E0F
MPYTYPDFVTRIQIDEVPNKRLALQIGLKGTGKKKLLVIQKNPSRANSHISDHTVNRVLNYCNRNRDLYPQLKEVGNLEFLNLIPYYLTDSRKLRKLPFKIVDEENLKRVELAIKTSDYGILAWGNPPLGLRQDYELLKQKVFAYLHHYLLHTYYVGSLSASGNPKHGQIWGYSDPLLPFDLGASLSLEKNIL